MFSGRKELGESAVLKKVVNLPFKVLGRAARAVQEREDAAMRERMADAVRADALASEVHIPKFDVPDDYQPEDLQVTVDQLKGFMNQPPFAIIDVREKNRSTQIPGSQSIYMSSLDIRLAELPPAGTTIIVYCQNGESSTLAGRFLRFRGLDEVFVLGGGLDQWIQENGTIEDSP